MSLTKKKMSSVMGALILVFVAVGIVFPGLSSLTVLVPYLLGGLLLASFLHLDFGDVREVRLKLVARVFIIILAVAFLGYASTAYLGEVLFIGVIIALLSPTSMSNPVFAQLVGGDMALSTVNMAALNLATPFYIPAALGLMVPGDYPVSTMDIFVKVFLLVFIPFIISRFLRRCIACTGWVDSLKSGLLLILISIAVASGSRADGFWTTIHVLPVMFLFALLSFVFGYMSSENKSEGRSLMIAAGHRNQALSIWIALNFFGGSAALPSVYYIVSHHVLNSLAIILSDKDLI